MDKVEIPKVVSRTEDKEAGTILRDFKTEFNKSRWVFCVKEKQISLEFVNINVN